MPVTPCFDPATGASGGAPPAASASLYDLTLTEVNLADGSWTLEDPDSLVDTVTYSASGNLVTWNTLAAGSANYRWDSGTTVRAPRWYKTPRQSWADSWPCCAARLNHQNARYSSWGTPRPKR